MSTRSTSVLQQGGSLTPTGQDFNLALQSMVLCRALFTYLGYPIGLDSEFCDVDHISIVGDICATAAHEGNLWDFSPLDVSTIVTPVLDYAIYIKNLKDLTPNGKLSNEFYLITPTGLHYKQNIMTMHDAWNVSLQLDALLLQKGGIPIYGKWIRFLRFVSEIWPDAAKERWTTQLRHKVDNMHWQTISPQWAGQNLIYACVKANSKIPATLSFVNSIRSANGTLFKKLTQSRRSENGKAHRAKPEEKVDQSRHELYRRTTAPAAVSNSNKGHSRALSDIQTSFTHTESGTEYTLSPEARKRLHEELLRGSSPID